MSMDEILKLALDAACDKWAEYRYLAGFDGSAEGQNYAAKTRPSVLEKNASLMREWDKKIELLQSMIAGVA